MDPAFQNIPVARRHVVAALAERFEGDEREAFEAFAKLLSALYHHELHADLEELKALYAPLNPDSDDRGGDEPDAAAKDALSESLTQRLGAVLERGNYRPLSDEALAFAFEGQSLFPITVAIDFSAYDDFVVYARGSSTMKARIKRWFGLSSKEEAVDIYDRVCLYIRFKESDQLTPAQRKRLTLEPGMTILKLFRNIPKADLEMLFPNTELRMRFVDKLLIGVPAVVGGIPVLLKLAPAIVALAIVVGLQRGEVNGASIVGGGSALIGLGLFLFRQWDKFKNRKVLFMKMLSENLYFRNLDNNEGVLTRLIDEAEEEEAKEALLAYAFLLHEPGLDAQALDRAVEAWLEERFEVKVDFEVDDALAKLVRLGLCELDDEGAAQAVPLRRALVLVDELWDGLFPYSGR